MKAIWDGSLSFGLVNIPIKIYAAVQPKIIGFKMLCGKCHNPLHYERWCNVCNKEVAWSNVVKGLEVAPGKFLIMTKEQIAKFKPLRTDLLTLVEFINENLIPPIFIENHYYIGPTQAGAKAFALLYQALTLKKKVAIGQLVMRERDYACVIRPYQSVFLMSTLYYAYEIRSVTSLLQPFERKKLMSIRHDELQLAEQLIDHYTRRTFDITEFKDTFVQRLKDALKRGVARKKIKKIEVHEPRIKALPLMETLKASLTSRSARKGLQR